MKTQNLNIKEIEEIGQEKEEFTLWEKRVRLFKKNKYILSKGLLDCLIAFLDLNNEA